MSEDEGPVRARIEKLVRSRFGRVEEDLVRSGILDSLRTIELALALEVEFGIGLMQLTLKDIATLTTLTRRIVAIDAESGS
jgi:acyl carrier protein